VIVDPTGDFLLVIDLGTDLIRINKIDKTSGKLTECPSVEQVPGTGPRHGAFWTPAGAYSRVRRSSESSMFFVANELTNTVAAWAVSYPSGEECLSLTLKQLITPYEGNSTAPAGAALAEIRVKDNFLYTSNRNDTLFAPNDSITQYTISCNGSLAWTDISDSHGTFPRTLDINKKGDYVAVGDQVSSNVAIVKRDVKTGKLGERVASLKIGPEGTPGNADGLSAVVWAE
jgi:6-phosphogluconolactonase (cycloisomerase 2 family)